jgi:hypothetical protein
MSVVLIKFVTFLSLVASIVACTNDRKPRRIPPSNEQLSYVNDVVLTRPSGTAYFEAEIPLTITYRTPADDNCARPIDVTHTFIMEADDYIDVTLTDNPGVDPGPLNTRAYVLAKEGTSLGIVFPDLIMEQILPAQHRLQVEKWRLKLNANENIAAEKGNGSQYAPPLGTPPFERVYPTRNGVVPPIGGKWRLYIKTTSVNTTLSVSLSFNVTNGPFRICK